MIVEDSRVVREFLEHIILQDPRFRITCSVGTGEEALRCLPDAAPDVISMDIRLPGMNGLELTKRIMCDRPTPIVVVSSDVEDEELKISMSALRAGALAVVQKPVGISHAEYENLAANLCNKLAIMSEVRVIQQRATLQPESGRRSSRSGSAEPYTATPRLLSLVASTGGPSALVRVINDLARDFPAPIVVVQHITPSFLPGFVGWLGDVVHFPVVAAAHGLLLEAGKVYVAPADHHLVVGSREHFALTRTPQVSMQRPSGTVLLSSVARVFGAEAVGVVLTGMGEDGAVGLKDMHEAGAYTIAEDASTAVVYGMPAACARVGAAREVLPLGDIGPCVNRLFLGQDKAR